MLSVKSFQRGVTLIGLKVSREYKSKECTSSSDLSLLLAENFGDIFNF